MYVDDRLRAFHPEDYYVLYAERQKSGMKRIGR